MVDWDFFCNLIGSICPILNLSQQKSRPNPEWKVFRLKELFQWKERRRSQARLQRLARENSVPWCPAFSLISCLQPWCDRNQHGTCSPAVAKCVRRCGGPPETWTGSLQVGCQDSLFKEPVIPEEVVVPPDPWDWRSYCYTVFISRLGGEIEGWTGVPLGRPELCGAFLQHFTLGFFMSIHLHLPVKFMAGGVLWPTLVSLECGTVHSIISCGCVDSVVAVFFLIPIYSHLLGCLTEDSVGSLVRVTSSITQSHRCPCLLWQEHRMCSQQSMMGDRRSGDT